MLRVAECGAADAVACAGVDVAGVDVRLAVLARGRADRAFPAGDAGHWLASAFASAMHRRHHFSPTASGSLQPGQAPSAMPACAGPLS